MLRFINQWISFLECFSKYRLFLGLKRYELLVAHTVVPKSGNHFRTVIRLRDLASGRLFDGMGEGRFEAESRLRALAEAYETLCYHEVRANGNLVVDEDLPYGMGVGLRRQTACLRAYGEYWERRLFWLLSSSFEVAAGTSYETAKITPYGEVYLCAIASDDGYLGTGYGFSVRQARDSARRSVHRKRDFLVLPRRFATTDRVPQETRITPAEAPWLECFWVGHERLSAAAIDGV